MPFKIIRDDITKVATDAIVNTANPEPTYGNGTDYAVYMAAGAKELLAERAKIGAMRTGEVFVTPAFRLPAKYIIHAVGPGWIDGNHGELDVLASCYRKSLLMAKQMNLES
nr:macro domain-containing protein [bacterium]